MRGQTPGNIYAKIQFFMKNYGSVSAGNRNKYTEIRLRVPETFARDRITKSLRQIRNTYLFHRREISIPMQITIIIRFICFYLK